MAIREENLGSVVGPQGPQGQKGDTGAKGPTGAQGPAGAKGADGTGWLFGNGVPTASQGKDGDQFLNTGTYDIYHKASGTWSKEGNIKGPKGDTGATGSQGAKGDAGAKGATGATGSKGSPGVTPSFEIRSGILYAIFEE